MRMFRTPHRRAVLTLTALLAACGGSSTPGGGGPDAGGGGPDGGGGNTTITGQVLDINDQPLAGRTVVQAGRTTTTDANGNFTFTTVAVPYDISIVQTSPKVATVYSQLTRTDPKLRDFSVANNPSRTTTVGGTLTGLSSSSGALTGVSFASPEVVHGDFVTANPWSLPISWFGPASITGKVHAMQWTVDGNGTLSAILTYGVTSGVVALTSGSPVSNADVALAPVASQPVTGTIALPSGYTISDRSVYVTFSDGATFGVSGDSVSTPGFGVPIPSGIEASAIVTATANNGTAQSYAQVSALAPGTSNVTLTLPSPASPTAPANGATGVDTSTAFVWTPLAGGVEVLAMSGQGTDPTYYIASGGTTARIPDLSAQGLGLPAARTYDWFVIGFGPFASIDAFAASNVSPGDAFQTFSSSSQFTTR